MASPETIDAIYGLWDGLPIHAGREVTVCGEHGRDIETRFADPRCWNCLAWLAEDKEPIEVPAFKGSNITTTFDGDERTDLIAVLRRTVAYA